MRLPTQITPDVKIKRAVRKPGSVFIKMTAAIYLRRPSRNALGNSSPRDRTRRSAGHLIPPYSVLLRMGLAMRATHAASGGLLPRRFTLTLSRIAILPLPGDGQGGLFSVARGYSTRGSKTLPRLAPAGCYPASCPAEPGLSSAPKDNAAAAWTALCYCITDSVIFRLLNPDMKGTI